MSEKNQSTTQSQKYGIVWLSIGLVLLACVAIFFHKQPAAPSQNDTLQSAEVQNLVDKEASARQYRSNNAQVNTLQQNDRSNRQAEQPRTQATQTAPHFADAPVRKQPLLVELNSADTLTLQLLPGIGSKRAQAIVRYRDRLGGFASTDQLLEVWSIDSSLLHSLGPKLRIDTSNIRRLNPNSSTLKQLAAHPYVEYYQARDIVQLRQAGVRFTSVDDLRAIPSMADSTLRRLQPYLTFE